MHKVLLLNTSEDVIEALRTTLETEGYSVQTGFVRDLRLGKRTLDDVLDHDPELVIFDLAPPYQENFAYYRDVFAKHPRMKGKPVLLTTTNYRALTDVTGCPEALELLLKPYDLGELLRRVKEKLPTRH